MDMGGTVQFSFSYTTRFSNSIFPNKLNLWKLVLRDLNNSQKHHWVLSASLVPNKYKQEQAAVLFSSYTSTGPEARRVVNTLLTDLPLNYTIALGIIFKASSDIKSVALFLFPSVDDSAQEKTSWRLLESSSSKQWRFSCPAPSCQLTTLVGSPALAMFRISLGLTEARNEIFVIKTAEETQLPLHSH